MTDQTKIAESDIDKIKFLHKRIDTIQNIVSAMCKFENKDIEKYILDSIQAEIYIAYSLGRFGIHSESSKPPCSFCGTYLYEGVLTDMPEETIEQAKQITRAFVHKD